ncbi:MAG: exo-alpha-sialidase [Victivallales bacterium]|nr:exo-alpha-sialidase [Victivallales bacterium]
MLNKPTVLNDGTWLLPTAIWTFKPDELPESLRGLGGPNLLRSRDQGQTFEFLHVPQAPQDICLFDEHWVVQLADGTLQILLRTKIGPWLTRSKDGGTTWTSPAPANLGSVNSRFVFRKLRSGRLLFVFHHTQHALPGCPINPNTDSFGPRENITAWLSDDDGTTWRGQLSIDRRTDISYPDVTEGNDGFLYLIYDRNRRNLGQILLARFTESDILAGEMLTPGSFASAIASAFPQRVGKG